MDQVPLFVPTRSTCGGEGLVVQLGHLPSGRRVGIAFTSLARLRLATGPHQDWIRLYDDALRVTLAGLGVSTVQVDPDRVASAGSGTKLSVPVASVVPANSSR